MSEQRTTTPTPLRGLRLLPADTGAGVGGDTAPDTKGDTQGDTGADTAPASVSVSDAELVPLSPAERIRLRADTAARIAGEAWAPCGRTVHTLWHPEPETMAEHRVYIRSREWVAPGITGKRATAIAWAGIAYHVLIGQPLKYVMKGAVKAAMNVDKAAERPLPFLIAAVFTVALVLLLLHA